MSKKQFARDFTDSAFKGMCRRNRWCQQRSLAILQNLNLSNVSICLRNPLLLVVQKKLVSSALYSPLRSACHRSGLMNVFTRLYCNSTKFKTLGDKTFDILCPTRFRWDSTRFDTLRNNMFKVPFLPITCLWREGRLDSNSTYAFPVGYHSWNVRLQFTVDDQRNRPVGQH